jgi:hypothetical protein
MSTTRTPTPADILNAALAYAGAGIPVFPCNSADKSPLTQHGFKDASTEPGQIRKWWSKHPNAMIGVPTGSASGVFAVDLDVNKEKGVDGRQSFKELCGQNDCTPPATIMQVTPRGGMHLLYRDEAYGVPNSASKLGKGIDVRGDGGYIVVAPSVMTGGAAYRWQFPPKGPGFAGAAKPPIWLLDLCLGRKPLAVQPANVHGADDQSAKTSEPKPISATTQAELVRQCDQVATAPEGTRNDVLNKAAFNLGLSIAMQQIDRATVERELTAACVKNGLISPGVRGLGDVKKTIKSGIDAGRQQASELSDAFTPLPTNCRPIIDLVDGQITRIVAEAEKAICEGPFEIYQRGRILVEPVEVEITAAGGRHDTALHLVPVDDTRLHAIMCASAAFRSTAGKRPSLKDPPLILARHLLSQPSWSFPSLAGCVAAPTLRADGSILQTEGYDPASRLLFRGKGVNFPEIPEAPSHEDAIQALRGLREVFDTFPFVSEVDLAVALSGLLTSLVRFSIDAAPAHAFTAPAPGTGKGKLVDMCAILATGRRAGVLSHGKNEEEMEKRLGAALIAGDVIIAIDNITRPLGGDMLCQILTQETIKTRVLGLSKNAELPTLATVFFTGNNLVLSDDLPRRTILCRIDAKMERPELREFAWEPVAKVSAERAQLIVQALTIMRAYAAAGYPDQPRALGSYEQWSRMVRGALMWVGLPDPVESMSEIHRDNPATEVMSALFECWEQVFGDRTVTAKDVLDAALAGDGGSDTLVSFQDVVSSACQGRSNTDALGKWLRDHKGKVSDGRSLVAAGQRQHVNLWKIEKTIGISASASSAPRMPRAAA